MPLSALLKTLKAAGVARYRDAKKGIEIEFGSTMEMLQDERPERLEGDARREAAKPLLRDPLTAAYDGIELPDERDPAEVQ